MISNIATRQKEYEICYDYQLTRKLPLIVRVDGVSFSRLTKELQRPYDPVFLKCMVEAMHYTVPEIGGSVIAYQQSDEISYVIRNDFSLGEEPWYGNRLQKIISVISSKTTLGFYSALNKLLPSDKLNLVGEAIFDARVFVLPSLVEVANNLIWRQQDCYRNAVNSVTRNELVKKMGKSKSINLLKGKSSIERKQILLDQCNIDFDDSYPNSYKYGTAIYRIPTIIDLGKESVTRNKWTVNWDLESFIDEKDFLPSLLKNGIDIFRAPKA